MDRPPPKKIFVFACSVVDVRLRLRIVKRISVTITTFKCNHDPKNRDLYQELKSLCFLVQNEIQGEEKYLFCRLKKKPIYIYTYIYRNPYIINSGKRNVCIYFNKGNASLWAEQKYFAG